MKVSKRLLAAALGLVTVASACNSSPFESALKTCNVTVGGYYLIEDQGKTLVVDGNGEEESGASYESIYCIFTALEIPQSVLSKISSTSSLDGRLEDSFGELTISWKYHPDNGLDFIVTKK